MVVSFPLISLRDILPRVVGCTSIGRSREARCSMAEDVRAEMVSTVFQVVVAEGDEVKEGDTLVILESMKMEIPVIAEVNGRVTSVDVTVGDVIQQGDLIAVIS